MEGSDNARIYLGTKYSGGHGIPADPERARYYFRLCAAHNVGTCQMYLGRLLLQGSGGTKDTVAGAAWLQLAKANSVAGADSLAAEALSSLTPDEVDRVNRLKTQLVRR
jgi:TPR repeat protein